MWKLNYFIFNMKDWHFEQKILNGAMPILCFRLFGTIKLVE